MKQYNLDFSFKGDREYVHGTDIYKQIIKIIDSIEFKNWDLFELNIRKISNRNMICFISDKKQKQKGEIINFVFKKDEKKIYGSIIENPDSEITTRYFTEEDEIGHFCITDPENQSIAYNNPLNKLETMDILIAMVKLYVENESDDSSKWFFRTLRLYQPIDAIEINKLILKKTAQKMNIRIFECYLGDKNIAQGYAVSIPVTNS